MTIRQLGPFILGVGLVVAAPIGGADEGKDKAPTYQTPEEVFKAAMAAGSKDDWQTVCACLTDDSRDAMAGMLLFAGVLQKAFAFKEEDKARLKPLDEAFARHNIDDDVIKNMQRLFKSQTGEPKTP